MKKYFIIIITTLVVISFNYSFSQSGMRFPELKMKLEPYFADELIEDIKKQLPQGSDYSIWGWDVGDYTGDGNYDVVVSIKIAAEKKKTTHVYFFIDMDGFLTKIAEFPFDYVELPLEIGIVIKNNTCYVTKKLKQFNWTIKGYTFKNGTLILLDNFITKRIQDYTHETYENFSNLRNTEKYIKTMKNEDKLKSNYLTIPSYQRGRQIYEGYSSQAFCDYVDYVIKGAYYWNGDKDLSYSVSSAYDQEYLYITVNVTDDNVVYSFNDFAPADYVEVWFDIKPPDMDEDAIVDKLQGKTNNKNEEEKGVFCFKILLGDFHEKKAFIKEVSSTERLYKFQKDAASWIKAVSTLTPDGYSVKFRIPLLLFGFDGPPIEEKKITKIGCTVVVHDIDNQYRPEEETQMASSIFDSAQPATYGTMVLIPQDTWLGEILNIYQDDVLRYLTELGF